MTNHAHNSAVRRAARVIAVLPAVLVTLAAGAASAEPPEFWPDTPSVSGLHVIVLLVLIPLGLFALICLLVYLPSMTRGNRAQSTEVVHGKGEWFGGPEGGLETVDTTAGTRQTGETPEHGGRSGASGSW